MHAVLAVLEKHEAWLPRLRSGEGKGETGEGTVEGRERGREGERERGREGERESVGKEFVETRLIEGCPR